MLLTIENIINLSEKKVAHLHALDKKTWKKLRKKYLASIKDQLEKADNNLAKWDISDMENHLWNLLWSYLCLVDSLEEDKITSKEEIFHRMFSKYHRKLQKNLSKDELIEREPKTKKQKLSLYLWNLMTSKKDNK